MCIPPKLSLLIYGIENDIMDDTMDISTGCPLKSSFTIANNIQNFGGGKSSDLHVLVVHRLISKMSEISLSVTLFISYWFLLADFQQIINNASLLI